jgi:hypothetical protein
VKQEFREAQILQQPTQQMLVNLFAQESTKEL